MNFELITENDGARRGRLNFPRGEVNTPAFMPVGTAGTDRKSTRLNSSHSQQSRMPSSA